MNFSFDISNEAVFYIMVGIAVVTLLNVVGDLIADHMYGS